MNQNVYQISCMCQHKHVRRHQILRFQRIYARHFNVTNQIKSMFATTCNTYSTIQCKIQIIRYINSQKLTTVLFWANPGYIQYTNFRSLLITSEARYLSLTYENHESFSSNYFLIISSLYCIRNVYCLTL